MKRLLTSSLFIILGMTGMSSFSSHAIYISVISIEHASGRDTAHIDFKIFSDDLRDAILHSTGRKFPFDSIQIIDYQNSISTYLNDKFSMVVNSGEVRPVIRSFEIQGDAVFISSIAPVPRQWEKTNIEATILFELFPTQQNMIHFEDSGRKQFARLSKGNQRALFE